MEIFSALKTKVMLLLGAMLGFAILYINALKATALKKRIEEQNSLLKSKEKTTKALLEGLENEARKPVHRDYFGD